MMSLYFLFFRYTAVQDLADKAKLLRKEAKGVQHMVMKDEVRSASLFQICVGPMHTIHACTSVLCEHANGHTEISL